MRKILSVLALLLAVAPACGEAEAEGGRNAKAQRFAGELEPLNGSEVRGTARLSLAGNHLTVDIEASGLLRNRIHGQHIHGLVVAAEEATCPRSIEDEDRDGDGLLELKEGMSAYGRSLWALEPFPTVGPSGRLDYDLTRTVDLEELKPLENRVLVLRGGSADRDEERRAEYLPDLPVACGELRPLEDEDE